MPHFFFDFHGRVDLDDRHGLVANGLDQAMDHAKILAAEIAATPFFAEGNDWLSSLTIRDEAGVEVHTTSLRDFAPSVKLRQG